MKYPFYIFYILLLSLCGSINAYAQSPDIIIKGTVKNAKDSNALQGVTVKIKALKLAVSSGTNGAFELKVPPGKHTLEFSLLGHENTQEKITVETETYVLTAYLRPLTYQIDETEITGTDESSFSAAKLSAVSDQGIYEAKKTEIIRPGEMTMNIAANNARQLYSRIPGLNIWESDGAGLQLGIGARGLSPDRTANFNTRQNGYDISADALGYPESYYTPPAEALDKIEIVRGAASLQYGTQFGGLLNFRFKEAPKDKLFEWTGRAAYGAYNLVNVFNSFGGSTKKVNYYTYYQFKRSDGYRPNSEFDLHNAYAKVQIFASAKIRMTFEYTMMYYLAHQPGGLTDAQFEENPLLSNRERNWFRVFWNIPALSFDIKISERTSINIRNFGLLGNKYAVGILEKINVIDFGGNRTILADDYWNIGHESRILHRYSLGKNSSVFLAGVRLYRGHTHRRQGDGSDGSGPDFYFLNPDSLENSDFRFLSNNIAVFSENIFRITKNFSITPGARLEYIETSAEGFYRQIVKDAAGNIVSSLRTDETLHRPRFIFLAGIGISYKPLEWLEVYGNFSQNYRAITYNDLRVVNPNFKVDENLQDEKGFNADLGLRGTYKDKFYFDISFFWLNYENRIGLLLKADEPPLYIPYRYRTNIADSRNIGVEMYFETDIFRFSKHISQIWGLNLFLNGSYTDARYVNTNDLAIQNKEVELVPPFNIKSGFTLRWKKLSFTYQAGYTHRHYTDATNAVFTANAISGIIPSYWIMDLSGKYVYKFLQFESGVNNFTNNRYFTRRSTGYPGPGIIPSEGITFYIAVQVKLGIPQKKSSLP